MITWANFPFLRLTPALLAGIVAALAWGENWPDLWPLALVVAAATAVLGFWLSRRRAVPAATAGIAPALLLTVALLPQGTTAAEEAAE